MHPIPILATFSNISGRPKDIKSSRCGTGLAVFHHYSLYLAIKSVLKMKLFR